jgi:CRP/FNR family transcriptional regulator, dissimilatory nitrate respiration regulator
MSKIMNILASIPLFDGLPEDQLKTIKLISHSKTFQKGEMIFFEGDDGNGFYIAVTGRVKIYKTSSEGKEQILHIIEPGESFGEGSVFSGKPFPANAVSLTASKLLFFPIQAFHAMIVTQPSIAMSMLAILSQKLRQFAAQIEYLSLKEVPGRLASYLIYLAEEQNNNGVVELTISKGQLASLLGTIPETLSRILAKMTDSNLIKVKGRIIEISDIDGLEKLANSG